MMEEEATGKRIILVGASSGIGAELARQYSKTKNPPRLTLAARRVEKLEEVAKQCRELGIADVYCVKTDATDADSVQNLMQKSCEKYGGIDVVYYIVGQAMHVKFVDITAIEKVCRQMMNTNFHGASLCIHYALPYLKESKGQFVAVSSVAGQISPPYLTFYTAGKHALHGFLDSIRNEEPGINITIVCPGYVATEIDDKKMIGDGTTQSVELNTGKGKYMPADKAANLIITAVDKKKKLYHLTSLGSIGAVAHGLFPGMVNKSVKKEMKNISKT